MVKDGRDELLGLRVLSHGIAYVILGAVYTLMTDMELTSVDQLGGLSYNRLS